MANKGMNFAMMEAKQELVQTVNRMIAGGIPVVALEMMLINLASSVSDAAERAVQAEQEQYNKQLQEEQNGGESNAV